MFSYYDNWLISANI